MLKMFQVRKKATIWTSNRH